MYDFFLWVEYWNAQAPKKDDSTVDVNERLLKAAEIGDHFAKRSDSNS